MFLARVASTRFASLLSIAACFALLGSSSAAGVFTGTVLPPGGSPAASAASQGTPADGRLALAATTGCTPDWLSALDGAPSVNGNVLALQVFDDGSGPALYVGGEFTSAGGVPATGIAKWDGSSWSAVGGGVSGGYSSTVHALAVYDDGSGPALYAGGDFDFAGGVWTPGIGKWNGASWSALGSGMLGGFSNTPSVLALVVYDDGAGPALHVGGDFSTAGAVVTTGIAKWDGASWSKVGDGLPLHYEVSALLATTGTQPELYVGGNFPSVGGVTANSIAKWDGTSWSPLGDGVDGYLPQVYELALYQDADDMQRALYAGGRFRVAGTISAWGIAKWDGSQWSSVGDVSGTIIPGVVAMEVFDDGSGQALYAGGFFTYAGGVQANHIAKWDGTSWSALGDPHHLNQSVQALETFDAGDGPALYLGGVFTSTPAGDSYLAKWGCSVPPITTLPGCAGNPATLEALAPSAPLGVPLPLRITGSSAVSGVGVLAYGLPGIDGAGCGLVVSRLGELLLTLVPAPTTLPSALLAGGLCDLSPLVPSIPSLSGVTVYLQGAAVDVGLPQPIELTNALAVKLGP